MVYSDMQSFKLSFAISQKNVIKVTLESRSTYHRCLQLIYIYICLAETCNAQIISLRLLENIILVLSFYRHF